MISRNKKYFTLFGILCATVDIKISSIYSLIQNLITLNIPKITAILLSKQLKPVKLYSTNKIK